MRTNKFSMEARNFAGATPALLAGENRSEVKSFFDDSLLLLLVIP